MSKWKLECPNGHKTAIIECDEYDELWVYCRGVKVFDKDEYDCKCEYSKWQEVDFADII